MRRRFLPALILTGIMAAAVAHAQANAPFTAGHNYYQRGEYEAAQQQYLAQVQQGPITPTLWYDLGNASLKLQQAGWAILYYERAALYLPRDRDLRANLSVALASRRVPPAADAPGWLQFVWQNLLHSFTLNELTGAALALYLASCALLVWRLRGRQFRRRHLWLLVTALALFVFVGSMTLGKWHRDWNPARAVVVTDGALYAGPADTFPALRSAYQGEMAHTVRREGFWCEVELENGSQGWILQSAVEPVVR
jgi:tetratricopeptide (TPR) repeat protein